MYKRLSCILFISLLANSVLFAQDSTSVGEHKDSIPSPEDIVNLSQDSDIKIAPWDSLHNQKRYLEKGKPFPFGNDSIQYSKSQNFFSRLSIGLMSGVSVISQRGLKEISSASPLGVSLSYSINRLSSIRATGLYTRYDVKEMFQDIKHAEVDLDYMLNLSNYCYGYNPDRRFLVSAAFGVGGIYSGFKGERKLNYKAQFGLNMDMRLTPNVSIFAEPFIAAASDQVDYSEHNNTRMWDLLYGAKAGIAFRLFNNSTSYDNGLYNRRLFLDMSEGYMFLAGGDKIGFSQSAGNTYTMSLGKWLDPYVGVKLSGYIGNYSSSVLTSTETVYNDYVLTPSYDTKFRTFMFGGRIEMMLNVLNMLKVPSDLFEISLSAGGDYGFFWRRSDVKSKQKHDTYYSGYTGAIQFVYTPDEESAIFFEPRLQYLNYAVPYVNAREKKKSFNDKLLSFNLGLRLQGRNRHSTIERGTELEEDEGSHFFISAHVGGNRRIAKYHEVTEGMPNIQLGLSGGYHADNYSLFRLKLEYMTTNHVDLRGYKVQDGAYYKNGVWTSTLRLINTELTYMFNFSNLYQGVNNERRVNTYFYLGPSYTYVFGHGNKLFKRTFVGGENPQWMGESWEGRSSFGLVGGAVVDLRINDRLSVFVEPEAQIFFNRNFKRSVSSFPDRKEIYNKFSLGSTYRF